MSGPTHIPLQTWQLFKAFRKTLGDSTLQKIFQRGVRQLQRWSADPRFVAEVERNPLDRLETILEMLCEIGREDLAYLTVVRLARIVGYRLVPEGEPIPDKPDWRDEIIDDYPAISEFHQTCQQYREGGTSPEAVQHTCEQAIKELLETKVSVLCEGKK